MYVVLVDFITLGRGRRTRTVVVDGVLLCLNDVITDGSEWFPTFFDVSFWYSLSCNIKMFITTFVREER